MYCMHAQHAGCTANASYEQRCWLHSVVLVITHHLVVSITVWLTKTQPYSHVTVESNNVQFIISSFCLNTRLLFSV